MKGLPLTRAAIAYAAVAVTAGCAMLGSHRETPHVSLVNLQLVEVTPFEQRYRFSLRLQNPNPVALRISGLSFALEFNDEVFARGVSDTTEVVPPYGEKRLDVIATSTTSSLLRQLRKLERARTLHYRLKGKVSSPDFRGPVTFDYPGSLPLRGDQDSKPGEHSI
jgi:LEA14-like dessication related protein